MTKKFEDVQVMIDLQGFLTPSEVKRLLEGAQFGDKNRNVLLLKGLAYTGRRVSELVGLKIKGQPITGGLMPEDIDLDNKQILWSIVKKGHPERRWIPCPLSIINELTSYINAAHIKNGKRVFPITRQRVFQIIRLAGKNAGINYVGNKKIHPHHLRHSYAVSLIRQHVPIYKLKKLLAHSTIMVTEAYLKIAPEDIRDSAEKISEAYDE